MASMTDLVFLLLIFFMITSTVVSPNALKLLLPQSSNQTNAKPLTTISITKDIKYYVNNNGKSVLVNFNGNRTFSPSNPWKSTGDVHIASCREVGSNWRSC